MSKIRPVKELRKLPIESLSDEEIVTVIRDLFASKFALIAYESKNQYMFLSACKVGGNKFVKQLQTAWEEKFGFIEVI